MNHVFKLYNQLNKKILIESIVMKIKFSTMKRIFVILFYICHNKKMAIIFLFFISCASSDIFVRLGTDFTKYNRVAVLPFQDFFKLPGSGNEVADVLSFALLETGFNVIDRSQTETLLREQGAYGQSGILDASTIPKIGKILGVQAIITGVVSDYSTGIVFLDKEKEVPMGYSNVALTIKMLDVETSQVVWAGTCKGSTPFMQGQLMMATKKAFRNVISQLPLQKGRPNQMNIQNVNAGDISIIKQKNQKLEQSITKVVKIKNQIAVINLGSFHGIKLNQIFKIVRTMEISTEEIKIDIGEAKVIKVLEKKSAIQLFPKSGFKVEIGDEIIIETKK